MRTLEISIPTYNRPASLRQTLELLRPQLRKEVRIRIFDNCSDHPAEEIVEEVFGSGWREVIAVSRNRVNVGGCANILKCFEGCEAQWLFILGDDDLPEPDMVATLLGAGRDYPDVVMVNFCSFFKREQPFKTRGIRDCLEKLDSYPNLNFISTNLYKSELLRKHIPIGYLYAGSLSPHIAISLSAIGESGHVVFETRILVERPPVERNQQWSYLFLAECQGLLLDLPVLTSTTRRLLGLHLARSASLTGTVVMQLLNEAVRTGDGESARYHFAQFRSRWFYFKPALLDSLRLKLFAGLLWVPNLSRNLILGILRATGHNEKVRDYTNFPNRLNRL